MIRYQLGYQAFFVLIVGCLLYYKYNYLIEMETGADNKDAMDKSLSPNDPSSYSRPDLCKVTNIYINLQINFTSHTLVGNVDLTVEKVDPQVKEVILDAKDLNIKGIYDNSNAVKLDFAVSEPYEEFGSKLTIQLPKDCAEKCVLGIQYETSPKASGLQWLKPEQTAGKQLEFMFSQFQAIHARSVIPCQDTPSVKAPYSAVISCPSEYTVVMSALNDSKKDLQGVRFYHFEQKVPVQSYLIAIAAGELVSAELGPRSQVWAEKSVIDAAAYEFADTEKQLKAAEDICGPYVWGRYDLLVLPPSFPFGGMENPCLTFVTPTLLAGDRSLANVIAHEIAHSWTGNLVTNKNFEHFWLNEGFTVFVERKIIGKLENTEAQDFQAILGTSDLKEAINDMGLENPLTKLVVNLNGVHPDDAFSRVPYEKGQTFLRYLEDLLGGPAVFEPFLRSYFNVYMYKSIGTDDFIDYFKDYFKDKEVVKQIDWNAWLNTPGMPPIIPKYNNALNVVCEKVAKQINQWNGEGDFPVTEDQIKGMSATQKIQFLQHLIDSEPQSIAKLKQIEAKFDLLDAQNAEIKFRWLRIGIKARWQDKLQPALKWLTEVGRMKFVRPLYRDLYAWSEVRDQTVKNFEDHRQYMMHVSAYTVARDLKLR